MLGPILFLVYVNDLPSELSSQVQNVRVFADDTAVHLTVGFTENVKVQQTDLERLSMWEKTWTSIPLSARWYGPKGVL